MGPQVPDTHFQERAGVLAVAQSLNQYRLIWREIPWTDVGIDGQIELVSEAGEATGRIVAAQIKSGQSYLQHQAEGKITYSPKKAHRRYWSKFPLPVLLFLHDPSDGAVYWAEVRSQLQAFPQEPIRVPLDQRLDHTFKDKVFTAQNAVITANQILAEMLDSACPGPAPVTFFDLFIGGLTDLAYKVYFGMDLFHTLLSLRTVGQSRFVEISGPHYEFLDRYVAFLIKHGLCHIRYEDYWLPVYERDMVGEFAVPLTEKGRYLTNQIDSLDNLLESEGTSLQIRLVQEQMIQLVQTDAFLLRLKKSISHTSALKEIVSKLKQ